MSKMTSSIHTLESLAKKRLQATTSAARAGQQPKRQPSDINQKTQSCNGAVKTLTNFSIDSIIGCARLAHCDQVARATDNYKHPSGEVSEPTFVDRAKNTSIARQGDNPTGEYGASCSLTADFNSIPNDPNLLPNNMARRGRPKHFQCNWCPLKFSNNGQLRNHQRIHTGERPFRCDRSDCGKTFTRNEELTRHKMIHSGLRPHFCEHCEKRFGRKDHLKKHERTHERKKSSRRPRITRPAHLEHNVIIPVKLEYEPLNPPLPMQPCYNIPNSIIPVTSQSEIFYNFQNRLPFTVEQNDMITNQLICLARAATTSTMTPSIPLMADSLEATRAIMTNANNAMQQLATNYLNSWINVAGQQS